MRLSIKVFTAGDRGLVQIPRLGGSLDSCFIGDRLDIASTQKALSSDNMVMLSDGDDAAVMLVALEVLRQLESLNDQLMDELPAVWKPDNIFDRRIHRKIKKEASRETKSERNCVRIRIDIKRRRSTGSVVVKVSMTDPCSIIGGSAKFAHDNVLSVAIILMHIRDSFGGHGLNVTVEEGDFCTGIMNEAEATKQYAIAKARYDAETEHISKCPNHKSGFCSPSVPECQFYENGRCRPNAQMPKDRDYVYG